MSVAHALLIALAGMAAGTINTVVGSGSLITFPTLIALGYPPVLANVSNNIGLVPGAVSGAYGYRRELEGQRDRLIRLIPASLTGALIGATLLLTLPSGVFKRVVIVLIVVALTLVILQPRLSQRLAARHDHASRVVRPTLIVLVGLAGVYGGYFGAAQGIILISLLGIFIADDLQRLNGAKNVLALCVNVMASAIFIVSTDVDWKIVGCIAVGSVIGGQIGATVGRRLPPNVLHAVIVVVGLTALGRLLLKRARMRCVYAEILYEVNDPIATITLNRPEALNAWTNRMGAEVRHAVWQAENDPAVVGVIITGAGRGFCAGADMNLLNSITEGASAGAVEGDISALEVPPADPGTPADLDGTYTWLLAGKKPVIAAINGAVAGMAVPIVMCCDLRFMAEDAVLLTAFAQRGLIAEWGLSWLLTRLTGPAVALDLMMSSRKVSGTECAELGLVNRALPADELLPFCHQYLEDLAARCSPASIAVMKRQVYSQLHAGLGPAEHEARRLMVESFNRPDFNEGVQSFREKRPPKFNRLGT